MSEVEESKDCGDSLKLHYILTRYAIALRVFYLFRPDRQSSAPLNPAPRRRVSVSARALVLAALVSALCAVLPLPSVLAQQPTWNGTVEVSTDSLEVLPGESKVYYVRLSEKPSVNGDDIPDGEEWFVMVHIGGVRYMDGRHQDLTLTPSFYRTFDNDDWDEWKSFRVER